ncbi:YgfZ/GcvT domain-containing protein [Pontixanthobacter sp.]|uniref:CAF17-like 4Fe-4S cluster assembly/insertion protein YgfZ n=1 Tax=Pontixanthobacter sp. TaxID=2792078 RepID=UPI003C7B7836
MSQPRLFNRAVIRLSPTDDSENVRDFLQGLVTSDVRGNVAGEVMGEVMGEVCGGLPGALPVWAGLLSAQGKTMFDFIIWADPDDARAILIDCEADAAPALSKRLSLYRLRRKITIEVDPVRGVYWQTAQTAPAALDPRLDALGYRWIMRACDTDVAADDEWLSHRLALGVPEGGSELGDILWLETNAVDLRGVSFEKGCYIGQENTARMNWRQKVKRRLVVVPLSRSDEKRRKAAYPDLDLAVDHMRVADITADIVPSWMSLGADAPLVTD